MYLNYLTKEYTEFNTKCESLIMGKEFVENCEKCLSDKKYISELKYKLKDIGIYGSEAKVIITDGRGKLSLQRVKKKVLQLL